MFDFVELIQTKVILVSQYKFNQIKTLKSFFKKKFIIFLLIFKIFFF